MARGTARRPIRQPVLKEYGATPAPDMGRIKIISTLTFLFSPIISSKSSHQKGGDTLHE